MEKIAKKQTSILKKTLITLGIIIGIPIVIIIVLIIIQPIRNGIDNSKFLSLKNQTKSIFSDIQKTSVGVDDWKYEAKCIDSNANLFGPADYYCSTTAILVTPVVSASQIKTLHEKYYPIIDNSKYLKPIDALLKTPQYQFGADFVISSADKQYTSSDGYKCTYAAKLAQPNEQGIAYSTPINGGVGQAILTFDCTGKAGGDWYKD
jgi:hypothetical protein